jgi:tubulin polyglutamylase TTLL6/13
MCFEVLGFDIILDDSFKPFLLEINNAPSFSCKSPLDLFVKHNLFKELFNLINFKDKKKTCKTAKD